MSDENGFGWVDVKDGLVIAYTGDPNDPTIHKFNNEKIVKAVRLQEIFDQDLIDWKHSKDMKPECGFAMMNQPLIEKIYSVLKHMKEESEKDD